MKVLGPGTMKAGGERMKKQRRLFSLPEKPRRMRRSAGVRH